MSSKHNHWRVGESYVKGQQVCYVTDDDMITFNNLEWAFAVSLAAKLNDCDPPEIEAWDDLSCSDLNYG